MAGNSSRHSSHAERELVREVGKIEGCHECNMLVELDDSQPWVADHIPPRDFNLAQRKAFGFPATGFVLIPQCDSCSIKQASFINQMASGSAKPPFSADQLCLVTVNKYPKEGAIEGSDAPANQPQRAMVNKLGRMFGCHSCGSTTPALTYRADHNPPLQFSTHWVKELLAKLGVSVPSDCVLKPHCPNCSNAQAVEIRRWILDAVPIAQQFGITINQEGKVFGTGTSNNASN